MNRQTADADAKQCCCIPSTDIQPELQLGRSASSSTVDHSAHLPVTVALHGGWFMMGDNHSSHPEDGEGPAREVWVDSFAIAATAVCNHDFKLFVDTTGYTTDAERAGSSFVFHSFVHEADRFQAPRHAPWWREVPAACWHAPEGPGSSVADRMSHPVVHVTYRDALHYCHWANARLATEAEWEFAARGGLNQQPYPWGDELLPANQHRCNIWQGMFPDRNTATDGYEGTCPVKSYPPNAYGLYNMTGNVWEWVADRFTRMHSPRKSRNPKGPLNGEQFVARGGSYLCHDSYCLRYRTSSRQALPANASAGNLGFRIVHARSPASRRNEGRR